MTSYDFGYSPAWTHAHLVPFAIAGVLTLIALWRRWPRWLVFGGGFVAVWALAGFLIVQLIMKANSPVDLPTDAFLPGGSGDVLDAGAGSGRSTVMVLKARPRARVTALDIYSGHFGIEDNSPERLRANAGVAGAADRVDVVTGDMREMPLPDARFDAAVSVAAIDHLNEEGITKTFREIARVVKPGGQFLLIVLNVDFWVRLAYPVPHGHGYFSHSAGGGRWRSRLDAAGFEIQEEGTRPATLYVLARNPARAESSK
jgi:SAM-dependent methyltransferase